MFFVTLAGHLGRDPETRFTPNGQKVTSFTLAINQRKGKEDVTTWVRITIWGDRFDKMLPYLKKGSALFVMGKMNPPSSYTDKEGRTQYALEVTAETIEFSPFGKTDRAQEGTQSHQAGDTSYGEEPALASGSAPARAPAYGAHRGAGQTHSVAEDDEDALPF